MKKQLLLIIALFFLLLPAISLAKDRYLQGRVLLVGEHDERRPVVGQDVTLVESGDTARTKKGGRYRIFLKDIYKPGSKITLAVERKDWRIYHPLAGEARVPDNLEKELVDIHLLPISSKKFGSPDRIEKLILDSAEKSKEQVRPEGQPQDIDFSRYIKDWAVKYGFSARKAKEEIDKWVAEAEQHNDPYQLGLAAYVKKNFSEASKQFRESAENKVQAIAKKTEQIKQLTDEAIRDYRLAGDAKYNNYQFSAALKYYQQAKQLVSNEEKPRLWADILLDIGKASAEIGIRTRGMVIHNFLGDAVTAYQKALTIYTKEAFPQAWARTQNNLGVVLQELGIRTAGEEDIRLLAEAVKVYRAALTVYTKEAFAQDWAMTQNNLGNVLSEQGIRTAGKEGICLLAEAVKVYRAALTIYTKEALAQDWAMIQNNLGNVLSVQGSRTDGEDGTRLLAEAVKAYRAALTVYTQEALPQHRARTQNNLGAVLLHQGIRTAGEAGARLLTEAVKACQAALTVFNQEELPQDWAMTQNNLGTVLREQGIRTAGEESARLLAEAVKTYRAALTVYTQEALPQDWARTQYNLAKALDDIEDWRGAAEAYRNVLIVYPDHDEGYSLAIAIYQEKLFAFPEAFALSQQWLERHPDNLSAQVSVAEAHFTTGRFAKAETRIAALLATPGLKPSTGLALRTLYIATLLVLNKTEAVPPALIALHQFARNLPATFESSWSFEGSKHFIANEPKLAPVRGWLYELFAAVEEKDRQKILADLERVLADFSAMKKSQ